MQIAVLGAGLTGTLAALELADAGHRVMLFDRCPQALARASLGCEGKVHKGFVYALDRTLDTGRMMIRGHATFRPLIERWTGAALFERNLSRPFLYAVPRDSLMPVADIRDHFARLEPLLAASGPDEGRWEELAPQDRAGLFDPAEIVAAFRTTEIGLDTSAMAQALRGALAAAPRITQRFGTEITGVAEEGAGFRVSLRTADGPAGERCDAVVNALWEQRLHIDATLGITSPRPVIHRYKVGLVTRDAQVRAGLPSVTFLIGCYGDTASFPDSAYVSWYPSGLLAQERGLRPSRFDIDLDEAQRQGIVRGTLENLRRLMPGAADCLQAEAGWEVRGGYITAWGETGIEDRTSELHERHAVGVHSRGRYHSIDTGKLTLAPLFAAEACARLRAA